MGQVLEFTGYSTAPIEPNDLMDKVKENWGLQSALVCGFDVNGKFIYGSSHRKIGDLLLLVELTRDRLIEAAKEFDE